MCSCSGTDMIRTFCAPEIYDKEYKGLQIIITVGIIACEPKVSDSSEYL